MLSLIDADDYVTIFHHVQLAVVVNLNINRQMLGLKVKFEFG